MGASISTRDCASGDSMSISSRKLRKLESFCVLNMCTKLNFFTN